MAALSVKGSPAGGVPVAMFERPLTAADIVSKYKSTLANRGLIDASLDERRGKNLACWCKPGEPCHADVLLELANGLACEEVAR